MPEQEGEPELLNTAQALAELGVSRDTLYRRIKDKEIVPIIKNPALRRQPFLFRREDIDRLKGRRASEGE